MMHLDNGTPIYCACTGTPAVVLDWKENEFGDILYLIEVDGEERWVHEETVEVA
jgi:hypothetical protein